MPGEFIPAFGNACFGNKAKTMNSYKDRNVVKLYVLPLLVAFVANVERPTFDSNSILTLGSWCHDTEFSGGFSVRGVFFLFPVCFRGAMEAGLEDWSWPHTPAVNHLITPG